jgi:glucosamine--fructose-6-phosphate aminotransferase (isomerizing)
MAVLASPPLPTADRTSHPFHTHDMIHEIPVSSRETLRRLAEPARQVAADLTDRSFLVFTGCGTAFYAAMLSERFVAAVPNDRIRSAALGASEISTYAPRVDRTTGVIGISHSGVTKTTVDALRDAKARGARTVGITHFADRPIALVSDTTLIAGKGPDLSRCHTKCYTGGALAAAQIALEWRASGSGEPRTSVEPVLTAFEALPSLQNEVLRSMEKPCEELAASHLERRSVSFFGTGPNISTAFEAALKVRETSFLPALGMEVEDFLHGSWQSLGPESLIFVVATEGRSHARAVDLVRAARIVGANVVALATEGDREIERDATTVLSLPRVDELLSPFVNIIPLYLYAYYSSVKRGHNPDLLRYLDPIYWSARQIVFPPGTH